MASQKLILWGLIIVGGLLVASSGFFLVGNSLYQGKYFPGTVLAKQNLTGKSISEAEQILGQKLESYSKSQVELVADGKTLSKASWEDLGVNLDPKVAAASAFKLGRQGSIMTQFGERLMLATGQLKASASFAIDHSKLSSYIASEVIPKLPSPMENAKLAYVKGKFTITPAKAGNQVELGALEKNITQCLSILCPADLILDVRYSDALVTTQMAEVLKTQIEKNYFSDLTLETPQRDFVINKADLTRYLSINNAADGIYVELSEQMLKDKLSTIKTAIDQDKEDAELDIQNLVVKKFSPGRDGINLNLEESYEVVQNNLLAENRRIKLDVKVESGYATLGKTANDLGIKELVARGISNFSGSPANRRHNIAVGGKKFRNILIAPNEKFSFVDRLGPVDASTGYLPELVIKGNQTIPEYGGGLCQVSTTAFRAILNGGFPITERKNHSYQVRYYTPTGTDATIYPGSADLKFINDSGHYLLMTNYIRGDELVFELYGTKPSYKVVVEEPSVYGVTAIPAPIYIDTSTLAPGVTRQVDSAHRGAKATLVRRILDESGKEIRKDVFNSSYVAWPAKILRGVEAAPAVPTNEGNIVAPGSDSESTTPPKPTTEI